MKAATRPKKVVKRPVRKGQGRKPSPLAGSKHFCGLDDPIRRLSDLADPSLEPLTNEEIDQILYGEQNPQTSSMVSK